LTVLNIYFIIYLFVAFPLRCSPF